MLYHYLIVLMRAAFDIKKRSFPIESAALVDCDRQETTGSLLTVINQWPTRMLCNTGVKVVS